MKTYFHYRFDDGGGSGGSGDSVKKNMVNEKKGVVKIGFVKKNTCLTFSIYYYMRIKRVDVCVCTITASQNSIRKRKYYQNRV